MIYNRPLSINLSNEEYLKSYSDLADAKKHFFNLGAGNWEHPCWTNIDLEPQTAEFALIQSPCIYHDFVNEKSLPISSNSVEAFYCSHVIEHITNDANKNLFKEVFRCLKSGGVFRIVTGPCADLDWNAILRKDKHWWYFYDEPEFIKTVLNSSTPMTLYDKWLYHIATTKSVFSNTKSNIKLTSSEVEALIYNNLDRKEDLFNFLTNDIPFDILSPGNHICWWNFEKLKSFLEDSGFKTVIRSGFGQSNSYYMRDLNYFDLTYPQISLYVEAIK